MACRAGSYVIAYRRGYQETDIAIGSSTTKVKGLAVACPYPLTGANCTIADGPVLDTADYVMPPVVRA